MASSLHPGRAHRKSKHPYYIPQQLTLMTLVKQIQHHKTPACPSKKMGDQGGDTLLGRKHHLKLRSSTTGDSLSVSDLVWYWHRKTESPGLNQRPIWDTSWNTHKTPPGLFLNQRSAGLSPNCLHTETETAGLEEQMAKPFPGVSGGMAEDLRSRPYLLLFSAPAWCVLLWDWWAVQHSSQFPPAWFPQLIRELWPNPADSI